MVHFSINYLCQINQSHPGNKLLWYQPPPLSEVPQRGNAEQLKILVGLQINYVGRTALHGIPPSYCTILHVLAGHMQHGTWRRARRANPNSNVERKYDLPTVRFTVRTYRAVRKCSSHARTIYAEVVEGEGEAHSWRLRVLR